jgi:hypothetical protein
VKESRKEKQKQTNTERKMKICTLVCDLGAIL